MTSTTGPELVHMCVDAAAAGRWAARRGLDADDTGYLVHALTRAALGEHGPQPFAIRQHTDTFNVHGYTSPGLGSRDLCARIAEGDRDAAAAIDTARLRTDPLPPALPAGRELTFRLDAVPVRRNPKRGEFDAHQPAQTGRSGHHERERDYADWLTDRLNADAPQTPCVELLDMNLEAFTIREVVRRNRPQGRMHRTQKPAATLVGRLRVLDGHRLIARMANGVGSHRQFGYGMLIPIQLD